VTSAGKRIRDNRATSEDLAVAENWRAAHGYIINTFQANLRKRSRNSEIVIGQRLKRSPTIFDKLRREPAMSLANMHDIAGCRVIFSNLANLRDFRDKFHQSRAMHKMQEDKERYNYILDPKDSGYRGIHDVYQYTASSAGGEPWNGLKIEIQYRTVAHHAWATAVETADLLTASRIKFSQSSSDYQDFFKICSELLARQFDGMPSIYPTESGKSLVQRIQEIDQKIHLFQTFRNASVYGGFTNFTKNSILIFHLNDAKLEIKNYETFTNAIEQYPKIESEYQGMADIVLVRGENYDAIKNTFRNYFTDTLEFMRYIEIAMRNKPVPV
jgi:ppGpp synthetase/RelA/SpoT-type nucleotidyltranferase